MEELFRRGRRVSHPLLTLLYGKTPEGRGPEGRVAFIAGKRIGGAVVRNRAKRLLREAARGTGAPWSGYDAALIARLGTADASEPEVRRALEGLLRRAGLRGEE